MISEVYLEDCLEGMKRYPDKFFELAIVDPPYGINAEQGTNRASRRQFKDKSYGWDSKIPEEAYFVELDRVSQHRIIWGGNYFLHFLGPTRGYIIWDKLNPDRCFADCEFAWTDFDMVARIIKLRPQTENQKDNGKIHPTQKPTALYKQILKNYAEPGMRVLDTHLGSGSHRIAAYDFGVDFTAFEVSPEYFKGQEIRFKNYISQLKLFTNGTGTNHQPPSQEAHENLFT